MKTNRILIITSLLIVLSFVLSACSGSAGLATSWPGLTVDAEGKTGYVAHGQFVYAINLENGTEQWRYPSEPSNAISFYAPPTLTEDGQLLVGGYDHKLYSINPQKNGELNWVFDQGGDRYIASPLAANGMIYAPNADRNLYALSSSGELVWKYTAGDPLWGTPTADGSIVYLAAMDHRIYALNGETGEPLWVSEDVGGAMVGQPVLYDSTLYLGTFNNELLGINTEDGAVKWRTATQGWVWSSPLLEDGKLYFGDLAGSLFAINAEDGSILWQLNYEDGETAGVSDRPLILDGTAYFSRDNGVLSTVDIAAGNLKWNKLLGGKLYAGPQLAGSLILIPSVETDAILLALDANGNQVWTFQPER